MHDSYGIVNKILSGFYIINKAYRWTLTKPSLLLLSLLAIFFQIMGYIGFLLVQQPENTLNVLNIAIRPENVGLIQSIAILFCAFSIWCYLALIIALIECTISLASGHIPYYKHALISCFSKILKLRFFLPIFIALIVALTYIGQKSAHYIGFMMLFTVINLLAAIYIGQSFLAVVHDNIQPLTGFIQTARNMLEKSFYHAGAISYYMMWYLPFTLLWKYGQPLPDSPWVILVALSTLVLGIISLIIIAFAGPAYTVYAALCHAQDEAHR